MTAQESSKGGAWVVVLVLGVVAIASLVQAAHFLRDGRLLFVGVSLGLPLVLLARRAWAVRVVQVALGLSAMSWLWTAYALMRQRQLLGTPYLRMLVILGGVALVAATAALALEAAPLRRALRRGSAQA